MDFLFFAGDTLLPQDALIGWFEHVTQIVLTLDNQKNAIRGETVSHFRSECQPPAQFEQGSTSSSASESMAVIQPPQSVTTLTLKVSARSAPPLSSPFSGQSANVCARPDSDSLQKMSEPTLSALAKPWPCTSQMSLTRLS